MVDVLLIDDDPTFSELMKQRLEHEGFTVKVQAGALGGSLSAVRRGEYKLVILDINMPGLSGAGLCDLIRRENAALPIFFLSSMDIAELRPLATKHGATLALSKGASRDQVVAAVRRHIGGAAPTAPTATAKK